MGWFSGLKLGSRLTTWLAGLEWGGIIKLGAGVGVAGLIWTGWNNVVGTVSDATGLSDDTVKTILFACIGLLIAYILIKLAGSGRGAQMYSDYSAARRYRRPASGQRARPRNNGPSQDRYRSEPVVTSTRQLDRVRARPNNRKPMYGPRQPNMHTHPANRPDLRKKGGK